MDELLDFYEKKSVAELKKYLDLFLEKGYVNDNSFEDPNDDAFYCLMSLSGKDKETLSVYDRKILNDNKYASDYLKSTCVESVYFNDKNYFFDYVFKNIPTMSAPVISKSMDSIIFGLSHSEVKVFFIKNLDKFNKRISELKDVDYNEYCFYRVGEIFEELKKLVS